MARAHHLKPSCLPEIIWHGSSTTFKIGLTLIFAPVHVSGVHDVL